MTYIDSSLDWLIHSVTEYVTDILYSLHCDYKKTTMIKFARNFAVGKPHLTVDEQKTLCGVPLTKKEYYPPQQALNIMAGNTCLYCYTKYKQKENKK